MLPLSQYPAPLQDAVFAYRRAISTWARASGLSRDDVEQEVVVATLAGEDPGKAVPRVLGLWLRRRGRDTSWIALDPLGHQYLEVADIEETLASEAADSPTDAVELGIGGTIDIARRLGVTRRRAQQLAAEQRSRFDACGDLFGITA